MPKKVSINKLLPLPGGPSKPITTLPNEIISLVGEHLSHETLSTARHTSKLLHQLWSPIYFKRECTRIISGNMMGLEFAVSRNRETIVQKMLETRPDMSVIRNSAGFTPLHIAADQGSVKMVELLLHKGRADYTLLSKAGDTPLHRAAKNGHLEVVRVFLDTVLSSDGAAGTEVINTKNLDGDTPVVLAAMRCHLPTVDLLISRGADTTVQKESGSTLLHTACDLGFVGETRELLEAGTININSEDSYSQNTPLHLAAKSRRPEAVRLLLEAGADVSARNIDGETALHYSASSPDAEIVKLLLNAGAEIDATDVGGATPLHVACGVSLGPAKALLEAGANVHAETDEDGYTPMSMAEENGSKELIRLLISAGAEPPEWDWEEEGC
ncbi:Nuclear factor NF-kappa-B p100 subunit [Arachnomyces sp. PD_36]|nr:Nuclear factor NF-kappa-B p100 subunit [Arachnomyces sp. PD_36]